MVLDTYLDKQIIHLTKKSSSHESTPTPFAGNHAHKVMYTDKKGYDTIEVWAIRGDSVYTIRCMAKPQDYSTYLPIFKR